MNLINLAYPYYGNPCEPALTDEFGNDVISDEGIKIYDAKEGNVVNVIPWGECKLLIDQYLDFGSEIFEYECELEGYEASEEEEKHINAQLQHYYNCEMHMIPSLHKALRAILHDEILFQVANQDYYECAFLFSDEYYDPYTFVLDNELDEPLITEDDKSQFIDVYFSKEEWAEFSDDMKTVLDPNADGRSYDITQLMKSQYPKYWRRMQIEFKRYLAKKYPDNEAKVARLLQGRVWTWEVME